MTTATRTKLDAELRDEWLQTIDGLRQKIKQWVYQEPGWTFEETKISEIEEPLLGRYTVPVWSIATPEGEARLEPIARNYPGAGIVELYAWPTLARVRLLQSSGNNAWRVLTDSGIFLRQEWSQKNFVALVKDLLAAE